MSEENNEGQANNEEHAQQVEKEARVLGWVPKEDFRDGDHWVDAETFVKRGKEINPILRKNNETLLKKLQEAQNEITEVKKVAKEFEAFQKEQATRRVAELEVQLKELKEQKKNAVTSGDGEAVVVIDDAIDAVKEQQREAKTVPVKEDVKPQATGALDPILLDWMAKNEWFTTDTKYTKVADALGVEINEKYPHLRGQAFLDQLDKELEEVLPERLQKKPRTNPVEAGGAAKGGGGKGKESYANLPADAKAACDKFVKQGLMTREQYIQEYDWRE